jgi:hypothetical protein
MFYSNRDFFVKILPLFVFLLSNCVYIMLWQTYGWTICPTVHVVNSSHFKVWRYQTTLRHDVLYYRYNSIFRLWKYIVYMLFIFQIRIQLCTVFIWLFFRYTDCLYFDSNEICKSSERHLDQFLSKGKPYPKCALWDNFFNIKKNGYGLNVNE